MITGLSNWAQQIIIAVIIVTIIELILPKGKNKKYIKMVLGIYILFTIISPILSNVTASNLDLNNIEYEKYFNNTEQYENLQNNFEISNENMIKKTFENNIKKDIELKLKSIGYTVLSINTELEMKDDNYSDINKIEMTVKPYNNKDDKETKLNNIYINKIEIGDSNNKEENSIISDKEKQIIQQFIAETYSVDKEKIIIK